MDINREGSTEENPLTFGRYVVSRLLGKGAMGEVYRAHDPVLDRKIALKVIALDPNLEKDIRDDYFARFSFEAKASAKLNHPSIVSVYDAGEEGGVPWIAFQFVEGESLEKLLERRGKLPVRRAIAFALDIASALQHAHAWSIIHRDVKPANILIESSTGIAKLADFGIVKAPWVSSTQEGNALGSPGYMSPEQVEGSDLDQRADIFGLGVVMYQMLSGKNPFVRDTLTATMLATCKGDFASLRDTDESVPPKLDFAVRRCLAADRKRRFSSAAELIELLKTVDQPAPKVPPIIKESVQSPPPGTKARIAFGFAETKPFVEKPGLRKAITGRLRSMLWLQKASFIITQNFTLLYSKISDFVDKKANKTGIKTWFTDIKGRINAISLIEKLMPSSLLKMNRSTISKVLIGVSLAGIFILIPVLAVAVFSGNPGLPHSGATEFFYMNQCQRALKNNKREAALDAVEKLSDMPALHAYTRVLVARILIRDGNYAQAAEEIDRARLLKGGRKTLKREIPVILEEIKKQLKKDIAPPELVDLVVTTLAAGGHPVIRSWLKDSSYRLRWNTVAILSAAGKKVEAFPLCIMDLNGTGNTKIKLLAVRKLGDIGDKRAIPVLKKIIDSQQSDPLVSYEAEKVLKEKFR